MSYVLDALKKSERERQAGSLPGLLPGTSYMVAPEKGSGGAKALLLAGAAMLMAGFALGAWRPGPATGPEAMPAQVVLRPSVELPALPAPVEPPVPSVPSASPVSPVSPALPEMSAASARPPLPPAEKPRKAAKPLTPTKVVASSRSMALASAEAKAVAALQSAGALPAGQVLAYRDLPEAVRGKLPAVSFGGFAGMDESEARIALINHRLVKEGEEVSPGVRLEEATPEGVVLSYQGYRFRPAP